jgi:hypothetical protein
MAPGQEETIPQVAVCPKDDVPADLTGRVNEWIEETAVVCDRAGPQYRPIFLSDAGLVSYGSADARSKHRVALERRLRRLVEIIGQV